MAIDDINTDRPLKNVESFADALRYIRTTALGVDIDAAIRRRGVDPTLPAEEIQKQLQSSYAKK